MRFGFGAHFFYFSPTALIILQTDCTDIFQGRSSSTKKLFLQLTMQIIVSLSTILAPLKFKKSGIYINADVSRF
jgi:hypothetical protein